MSARPLEMCRGAALASLLLVALTGCGTTVRSVRLDTGQGEPLVHVPRGRHLPVELTREELTPALGELARGVRPPTRPQEAARRLFEMGARSGSFLYEARDRRLTPLAPGEHLEGEPLAAELELTRAYLRWCERTGRPGDCLLLLTECPTLNGDGRYALAMALARGAVLDEMLEAFKDMADPHAMVAAVLWTWTTYMLLLAVPEPVSKGLAAVMTVTLISYVGVDTFWSLIVGFKQLVEEADRATTFHELREAGERYGKVMGHNAARAFALLATAAIGHTAAGLAAKVPKLPGSVQAAAQAQTQVHIRLAAVGAVEMVSVSAETLTLSLAPGALAMSAQDSAGADTPTAGDSQRASTSPTRLKPESIYLGSKKHGIHWTEGSALARSSRIPQGQWGSAADLEFAGQKAATLASRQGAYFDLPPGHSSTVWRPDGTRVAARRIWVRNNGNGTFHGYPLE
ncbi:hypothetical protein [Archangium sp.]|uniref:SitA5 family polymorphic toxin n=1 Tax=Archangium sp. TaxID=1872627 RepID=UPI002D39F34F|nr:hypothetical protein [Archangium sp.]HYO52430.1 hypothetical protein [Archangium sp.]